MCVSRGRVGGWEALGGRGVGLAETGWRLRGSWPCDGDVKLCATAPRLGCRCWAADAGLMLMSGEAVRPPRTGERPARAMTIARACCACGGAGSRRERRAGGDAHNCWQSVCSQPPLSCNDCESFGFVSLRSEISHLRLLTEVERTPSPPIRRLSPRDTSTGSRGLERVPPRATPPFNGYT